MKVTSASAVQAPRQMGSRQSNRDHAVPYKLVVLAADTADAVSAAGGLIVDTVRAGWQVDIYLEAETEPRALQILGANGRKLPADFDFEQDRPDAVVFAAPLYDRHRGVRRFIADATRQHGADVAAWDGSWPAAPGSASGIEHRLSAAAVAFKFHAMKAVGAAAPSPPVEEFYGGFHPLTGVRPPAPG